MAEEPQKLPLSFKKKLLFAVVCSLLPFLVLEGLLRFGNFHSSRSDVSEKRKDRWDRWGMMQDPSLPWSWIPEPNATRTISVPRYSYKFRIHFNEQGYRGPLFAERKKTGRTRILCMGDSCTMGWGVGDQSTYPFLLQTLIKRKTGEDVDVINAGVLAYTSFQGLHQLQERTLQLQPDVILICYNWNDHLPAVDLTESRLGTGISVPDKDLHRLTAAVRLRNRLSFLATFQLMENYVMNLHTPTVASGSTANTHSRMERVELKDFEQNIQDMIQLAESRNARPILLTQPINPLKLHPDYEVRKAMQIKYNEALRQIASDSGIDCIDLTAYFSGDPPGDLFLDELHTTKKGEAMIARTIASKMISLHMVHPHA